MSSANYVSLCLHFLERGSRKEHHVVSRRRITSLESTEVSDACPHYMFGRRCTPLCRAVSGGVLETPVSVLGDRTVGIDALRRGTNALGPVAADCGESQFGRTESFFVGSPMGRGSSGRKLVEAFPGRDAAQVAA